MLRIGDKVEIGLLRDGKPRKVTALIAERSDIETANAVDISKGLEGAELGDAPDGGGVLVKTVQDGQPCRAKWAARQRFDRRRGRTPVTNTKTFKEAAKSANVLVLNVRRGIGHATDPDPLMPCVRSPSSFSAAPDSWEPGWSPD